MEEEEGAEVEGPLCGPFKLAVTFPPSRRVEVLFQSASGFQGLSKEAL